MGYVRDRIAAENSRRVLPDLAHRRLLRARSDAEGDLRGHDPVAFVHALSAHLEAPEHLRAYGDALADPFGKDLRLCFAAPPQHGKTETTLHAMVRVSMLWPGKRHAYLTYNQTRADEVAFNFWNLAERAGLDPQGPKSNVRLRGGTEIRFRGMNSGLTGAPIDGLGIIDDPIKDALDASSLLLRERAWSVWQQTVQTRLHPGCAVIVMATRWHVDDPTGRFIKDGWPYLNLRAMADGPVGGDGKVIGDPLGRAPGEALWPAKRPMSFLDPVRRKSPFVWATMYQGEPRLKGGKIFDSPALYNPDELPRDGYRIAHGIDLAYSKRTRSDWSVCWTMMKKGDVCYVVDVIREHERAPEFAARIKKQVQKYPGRVRFYGSTTEVGTGQLLGELGGIQVNSMLAKGDKGVRAEPLAAAWNAGDVRFPRGRDDEPAPEWVADALGEFGDFTGIDDPHDDMVDAAAACFDELGDAMPIPKQPDLPALSRWDGFDDRGF